MIWLIVEYKDLDTEEWCDACGQFKKENMIIGIIKTEAPNFNTALTKFHPTEEKGKLAIFDTKTILDELEPLPIDTYYLWDEAEKLIDMASVSEMWQER
jgi:hypothetical protein